MVHLSGASINLIAPWVELSYLGYHHGRWSSPPWSDYHPHGVCFSKHNQMILFQQPPNAHTFSQHQLCPKSLTVARQDPTKMSHLLCRKG